MFENILIVLSTAIGAFILVSGSFMLMFFKSWYQTDKQAKQDIQRLLVLHERELQPNAGKSLVDKVNKMETQMGEILSMLKSEKSVEN